MSQEKTPQINDLQGVGDTRHYNAWLAYGKFDGKPKPREMAWPELVDLLTTPTVSPKKDGPGIVLQNLDGQGRKKENALSAWAVCLDIEPGIDEETGEIVQPRSFDEVCAELEHNCGWLACAYTTHSHLIEPSMMDKPKPKGERYRLVLPLDRPVAIATLHKAVLYVAALLSLPVVTIDPASWSSARLMYLPRHHEGYPFRAQAFDGQPLSADMLESLPEVASKPAARPVVQSTTLPRASSGNYGQVALQGSIGEIMTAAERNKKLNDCAIRLYSLALGGHIGEEQVTTQLEKAALAAGLTQKETTATLKSARAGAQKSGPAHPAEREGRPEIQVNADVCEQKTEPWPEPLDIFGDMRPPAVDLNIFPQVLASYAKDVAERVGMDAGAVAVASLGAVAGCIDDRLKVQVKRYDTEWRESARLWVGLVGEPSAKKSPAIQAAMAGVRNVEKRWAEGNAKALADFKAAQAEVEDKKAAKAMTPPPLQRVTASDVTTEGLQNVLAESTPRGILVYRDELAGWLQGMDAYKSKGGGERAAWLEAYNGGRKHIDRVIRGSLCIENWSASVIGGIQPDVAHSLLGGDSDGLPQRFCWYFMGAASRGVDRTPDYRALNAYEQLCVRLAELPLLDASGDVVKLSDGAHDVRERIFDRVDRLTSLHGNKHVRAAMGKWAGLAARLMLVFHCMEQQAADIHPASREISAETAERVERLLFDCLLRHLIKFYDGADSKEGYARSIGRLILAKGWTSFTPKRDFNQHWRESRKIDPREIHGALDFLEAFQWIVPVGDKLDEHRRPVKYLVNPRMAEHYQEERAMELKRRAEITAMIAELR